MNLDWKEGEVVLVMFENGLRIIGFLEKYSGSQKTLSVSTPLEMQYMMQEGAPGPAVAFAPMFPTKDPVVFDPEKVLAVGTPNKDVENHYRQMTGRVLVATASDLGNISRFPRGGN